MENVEWEDVQGLLRSGFPDLPNAAYILWRFLPKRALETKEWIEGLANRLTRVEDPHPREAIPNRHLPLSSVATMRKLIHEWKDSHGGNAEAIDLVAVNLALTASGLTALGVEEPELACFSSEFREGMAPKPPPGSAPPRRSNVLGDIGDNSPEHWEWGGWNPPEEIDGVLLLYAANETSLQKLIDEELKLMRDAAEPRLPPLNGRLYEDHKEHFGFRDGISQPAIEGTGRAGGMDLKQARISVVKPGEFVLGYLNERVARVTFSDAPAQVAGHSGAPRARSRDLGRNGTYLVFRQLEQNVHAFNEFIAKTVKDVFGTLDADTEKTKKEWLAARLVGRNRIGEPLIPPAADSSKAPDVRNDFLYYFEDRFGLACPIGAHIRRANPRDALGPDPDTALRLSKMHRIIRRGRLYGERLSPWAKCEARDVRPDPRGLYFICLNADIAGQFEMVQHSWLNGAHFDGLYHEMDPMSHYPDGGGVMTIQHRPTNMSISIPKFVRVRGGAYFFLPGIRALLSLAQPRAECAPLTDAV